MYPTKVAFATALLVGISYLPVGGQVFGMRDTGGEPVLAILVGELPYPNADAVVIRRPEQASARDLIVLPSSADAEVLMAAANILLQARRNLAVTEESILRVLRERHLPRATPRHTLPVANAIMARLRSASAREVAGFGTVPVLEFWFTHEEAGAPQ